MKFQYAICLKLDKMEETKSFQDIIKEIEAERRLSYIAERNPEWFSYIMDFLERNPIFKQYSHIVSLDPNNRGDFKSVKKTILYYICFAGVRKEFGHKLWLHVDTLSTKQEVLDSAIISPRKKQYLSKAIELPDTFTLDDLHKTKIAGIGVSGIAYIHRFFSNEMVSEYVEYTDIYFLIGIQKIYKLAKRPTPKEALSIVNKWGVNKSIGNMFCLQACSYL